MKTIKLYSRNARTKLSRFLLIGVLIFTGFCTKAQVPISNESLLASRKADEPSKINMKELTAKTYNNIVYFEFSLNTESENCVLLFEKSVNGKDFIVIDQQKTIASINGPEEKVYSFQDQHPNSGTTYYRILQIKKDSFLYSPTATLSYETEMPLVFNSDDE